MATIDTIRCNLKCPKCSKEGEWIVQIKFGDPWMNEWKIGDKLHFDEGSPPAGLIKTCGHAQSSCTNCKADGFDAEVYLRDMVFEKVILLDEGCALDHEDDWVVVDEQ